MAVLHRNQYEAFAQAVAGGMNHTDAWRMIHPKSKASNKSAYTAAYKLARLTDVSQRIAEIQAESRKSLVLTRQEAMEILTKIAQSDKGRTAIAAIDTFAKMDGWDKPDKIDVTGTMQVIGLDDIRKK